MSFIETLLSGNSNSERRNKYICAILIAATAVLLVIALIVFTVFQIANISTNNDSKKDSKEEEAPNVNVGETVPLQLSDEAIYSGNLLTLSAAAPYKGTPDVINLQSYSGRSKTDTNENSYTVLKANQQQYHATEKTAEALNKMLQAFYNAKKDDNILIAGAYNVDSVSSQDAVYSSGEAIALEYFHDYANNGINDPRSIAKVELYKWIYSNAHKYGFVAVSANSNVFRYVGVTHATAIKTKGLSVDNYLKQLKLATVEAPMLLNSNGSIIAYYCPKDDVKVPKNYSYEVSGNNVDGFFITVDMSKSEMAE